MRGRGASTAVLVGTATVAIAGCSGGGGSGGGFFPAGGAVASGASSPVVSGSSFTPASGARPSVPVPTPTPRPAHVALLPRGLAIDGKARFLLGGEVQYFRVRDPGFDAARTHALWEDALDKLQAASLNLVSTYVPWDYHEEVEGRFDFKGARDLDRFLESCWRRGLVVHLKPGPLINAEWPNGLGSFGGAPGWFKQKNAGALALGPDGKPISVDLLGGAQSRQPSFFAPEWRDATRRWFSAVAPIVRRYVFDRPTIALIQLDNETNFYFRSRFASDYSVHGLAQFRKWLERKYGTVAALNAAWGTLHASFDVVPAPSRAPAKEEENLPAQDWFDAGKDGIAEYHLALRAMWESLGIREPDVLFTTNDSPHPMPLSDQLLWDGPTKNAAGLAFLDAYPKQFPHTTTRPLDYPFLTSFFAKRFDEANDLYRFAGAAPVKGRACFGAELEGGLFPLPLGLKIQIPEATTDHVLCEFVARGGVVGSVYVLRGGTNRDGSSYDFQAAIGEDGSLRPRYDVLRRWGRVAAVHGNALLESEPVEASVALVVDARLDAPAAGVVGHPGWIQTREAAAAFGWLEDAGLDPVVRDARGLGKGDLDRFGAVVFLNPDAVHDGVAEVLDDYVARGGGTLVNLLHAGTRDGAWKRGGVSGRLLARGLFSDGNLRSVFENTLIAASNVNLKLPGLGGSFAAGPFLGKWDVAAPAQVIARDRTFPFGLDGDAVAWSAVRGKGKVVFLGTNPGSALFGDAGYYDADPSSIKACRALARWVAATAGVAPLLEVARGDARAIARRVPGDGAFLFLASRLGAASQPTVRVLDLAALGLVRGKVYRLEEASSGAPLGQATGADLEKGLALALGSYGTAVVRIYE